MKTIRNKLFVILLSCSTLTMLVFAGISLFFELKLVKEVETNKLIWMARYYAEAFSREMSIIEDKVQELDVRIKDSIDIQRLRTDKTYLQQYSRKLAPIFKKFADRRTKSISAWVYFDPKWSDSPHDIYFVDGDGDNLADRQNYIPFSYYNHIPEPNDDKQWWYAPLAKGSGFWTNPYEWTLKNNEVIKVASYAQPIIIDNITVGVVGTYYRFTHLYEEICQIKPYTGSYASLFNEKLDVVIHPVYKAGNRNTSDNLHFVQAGALADLAKRVQSQDHGIIPYNDRGTERLFAYSTLANGWIFAINPPVAVVYADLYRLEYTLLLAFLGSLFFLGIIAFGTGRIITTPLLSLVEAAKKLGSGDLSTRVTIKTQDEIHDLANAFNSMAQNLKGQQERLSNLIQGAGMCTWTLNRTANVFAFDAPWHRLLELSDAPSAGEWSLEVLRERIHPEDQHTLDRLLGAAGDNVFLTISLRVRATDGTWRYTQGVVGIDACLPDGRTDIASGISYDITAQVRAFETEAEQKLQLEALVATRTKELLESRDLAEAASKAKTVFLSTVSHEIRTPMNAILGFTHIFGRTNLTLMQKEYLEKIKLSSVTLLNVINDVLDISKIEAGKLELECAPFRLDTLLDTVRSIIGFAAHDKNIAVTIDVASDVPVVFEGDAKRISQILLNLLNNAIKFTEQGAVVLSVTLAHTAQARFVQGAAQARFVQDTAQARFVQDAAQARFVQDAAQARFVQGAAQARLEFTVVDTGIGLTEEQMGRLFTAFSQADSSVTRKYGGTGLGLAICKQLVELMQGTISVTSTPGQGSIFRFSLVLAVADESVRPKGEADSHLLVASASRLKALQGIRVLVVEDNLINQEIARALLEEHGLDVDMAHDGQAAIDVLLKTRYACIFMDMQMPVLDGLECARRLRTYGASDDAATAWLGTVPIIAMTANAMAEDRQRCLDAGMNDHISKPLELAQLTKTLMHWLVGTD